jgi:hypothetical protein
MTLKKVKPTTKKVANVKKPAVKMSTVKSTIGAVLKKTKATVMKKVSASAGKKAPAKTSAKKTPAKTTKIITKKTSATKAASPQVESGLIQMAVTPTLEERYRMVETAAYFIAEQHGFHGRSDEHWAAAERAIAGKLGQ